MNAAFQSYAGPSRGTFWAISSTTTYGAATGFTAANCVAPCVLGARVIPNLLTEPGTAASMTLALQAPGTDYYGRMNQLDMGFRKLFRYNRYQWSAQADIFNVTNNDYVKSRNEDLRRVARPSDVEPPAAHAAAGGADAILARKGLGLRAQG